MSWKEVGKYVKKFAPVLGTAVAGPAGGALGGAVSLLCSAFGIESEDPQPDEVLSAIKFDPEAGLKLRKLELNHKTELRRIALELDRAYLADVQSARSREVELVKATGKRDINLYILAWSVVVGFFLLTGLLMFIQIQVNEAALLLFGSLASGFGMVLQYFFGSSRSSREKTDLLATRAKG